MDKLLPIQDNFAAGEISPRYYAQTQQPAYQAGLKEIINWITTSQGTIRRRFGTYAWTRVQGYNAFEFDIPINSYIGYKAIMTDMQELYIRGPGGVVTTSNLIQNPRFIQQGTNWTSGATYPAYTVFHTGAADIIPGDGEQGYIEQAVTVTNPSNEHWLKVTIADLPNRGRYDINIGTTPNGVDIAQVKGTRRSAYIRFTPGAGVIYVRVKAIMNPDNEWVRIQEVQLEDTTGIASLVLSSPYTMEQLDDIQFAQPPGSENTYVVNRNHAPYILQYTIATDTWSFSAITFTASPWSAGDYPGSVAFFQGRCWWGGTYAKPETFWASKSADYTNITIGTAADDAFSFTLDRKGAIQWMAGSTNLLIGTEYEEIIVTSEGGLIQPSDRKADMQSAYGSARVQALAIGNKVLYVSGDRRKIRSMGFEWTNDGWVSRDDTFVSEHITKNDPIKELVYAQDPDNLLVIITRSGNMLGCTYERGNDIVGWHRHTISGNFRSAATVKQNGTHEINFVVHKEVNSTHYLYIMTADKSVHTDFTLVRSSYDADISAIENANALAGETVQVVVDGAIHPDVTLDASGYGELQIAGYEVVCGIAFPQCEWTTLPARFDWPTGAEHGLKKSWNKVAARIINSSEPSINGKWRPDRHPGTNMDEPEPLVTDDIPVTLSGWSYWATLTIAQPYPVYTEVAGIFGELVVSDVS